jgi:hypothetical protein
VTTSRAKAKGSAAERLVARVLGGRRVGHFLGKTDVVVDGWLRVQVKTLDVQPSLNEVRKILRDVRSECRGEMPAAVIFDRPGSGHVSEPVVILPLVDFAAWYATPHLNTHSDKEEA